MVPDGWGLCTAVGTGLLGMLVRWRVFGRVDWDVRCGHGHLDKAHAGVGAWAWIKKRELLLEGQGQGVELEQRTRCGAK